MAVYFGRNRATSYTLGRRLGGGGEGEVYEITGMHSLVAKIYFKSKFHTGISCPSSTIKRENRNHVGSASRPVYQWSAECCVASGYSV